MLISRHIINYFNFPDSYLVVSLPELIFFSASGKRVRDIGGLTARCLQAQGEFHVTFFPN